MGKVIATIELDNDEGRGELFWEDGGIRCRRESDGEEWDTATSCEESDAADTIEASWGRGPWDLQWKI